jgi:single-strand DNA-binding protein
LNKVILYGNVVKDAELSASSTGTKRCSFSIAINDKRSDGVKTTTFIPLVAWGSYGESLSKYATKGTRLLIEGSLSIRAITNGETKKTIAEVVIEKFEVSSKQQIDDAEQPETTVSPE